MNSLRSYVLRGMSCAALCAALSGCGCSPEPEGGAALPGGESAPANTNDVSYIQARAQEAFSGKDWGAAVKAFCRLAYDETLPPEAQSVGWAGKGLVDFARLEEPDASNDLCDTSRAAFMHAVRLDKRNSMARFHLGRLYMEQFGFAQAALDQFEMYIALTKGTDDPRKAKVQGWIDRLKAEIAAGQADLPGFDRRNPSACAAALRNGDALYAKKMYTKARASYAAALKADPLCYDAAVRLARCWETTDKSRTGRANALKAYRHAASLRAYPKTLLAGASLAERIDSRAVATSLYSKALAAGPTSREAVDGLVRMLEKNGQAKSATAYRRYRNSLPADR